MIFHEGTTVPVLPKLKTRFRLVAVVPEFGTVMYTAGGKKKCCESSAIFKIHLLCWPGFSPQISGTVFDAPSTRKTSVEQTESVPGCSIAKEVKSNLTEFRTFTSSLSL